MLVFAHFVDLHDVRMLQARDGFGLGAKTRELVGSGVAAGENHLQRDQAFEACLAGAVNHAHAAAAENAEDLKTGDRRHVGQRIAVVGPGRAEARFRLCDQASSPTGVSTFRGGGAESARTIVFGKSLSICSAGAAAGGNRPGNSLAGTQRVVPSASSMLVGESTPSRASVSSCSRDTGPSRLRPCA